MNPIRWRLVMARTFVATLVFVLASLVELPAQRSARVFLSEEDAWPLGVQTQVGWAIGGSGELSFTDPSNLASGRVRTGVEVPGTLLLSSAAQVLVGGRDGRGVGRLECWRRRGDELAFVSASTVAGADFTGLFHDADSQHLYVLDCVRRRISKGAWDGNAPLATVEWRPFLDASQLPFLLEAEDLVLVPGLDSLRAMNLLRWPIVPGSAFTEIVDGETVQIRHAVDERFLRFVSLVAPTVHEGATAVDVWAVGEVQVEVVETRRGVVIGASVVRASHSGAVVSVALSQPLRVGERYVARRTGHPSPDRHDVVCVARHGSSETFADGAALGDFWAARSAAVGRDLLVGVGRCGFAGRPVDRDGMLLVGLRAGAADSLLPCGDNVLLSTCHGVPARVLRARPAWGTTGTAAATLATAAATIVIPNEPSLVGAVLLTQFVMRDGPDFVLSQVQGARLEAAGPTADAAAAAWSAAFAAASPDAEAAGAAERMLDATPLLLQVLARRH